MNNIKSLAFLTFVLVMFNVSNVMALKCASGEMMRARADILYLVRIVSVDKDNINRENEKSIRIVANIEVLRIYKGDIEKLSNLEDIPIIISCNDLWGPSCLLLDTVLDEYKKGDEFVLDSGFYINNGKCGSNALIIKSKEELVEFEKEYKPVWIRQ